MASDHTRAAVHRFLLSGADIDAKFRPDEHVLGVVLAVMESGAITDAHAAQNVALCISNAGIVSRPIKETVTALGSSTVLLPSPNWVTEPIFLYLYYGPGGDTLISSVKIFLREVAKACLLVYEGSTSETKIGALNAGLDHTTIDVPGGPLLAIATALLVQEAVGNKCRILIETYNGKSRGVGVDANLHTVGVRVDC